MFHCTRIAAIAALTFGAASICLAKSDGIPTIDVQHLCSQNDAAIRGLFSDINQDYVSICVADEQGAREEIVKDWATFSAAAKVRCLRPADFLPSYVEWLQCLAMDRDVAKIRKEESAAEASSQGRKQCPVISRRADGYFNWIDACALR